MCEELERQFPCRLESVTKGRHVVDAALTAWGIARDDGGSGVRSDVLLVAAELLANAARACRGDIVLSISAHRRSIRILVCDDSAQPAIQRPAPTDGGRGLAIVDALAAHWGQRAFDGSSKAVWATISLPSGSELAVACRL